MLAVSRLIGSSRILKTENSRSQYEPIICLLVMLIEEFPKDKNIGAFKCLLYLFCIEKHLNK